MMAGKEKVGVVLCWEILDSVRGPERREIIFFIIFEYPQIPDYR
jgi:hypothetical protein